MKWGGGEEEVLDEMGILFEIEWYFRNVIILLQLSTSSAQLST